MQHSFLDTEISGEWDGHTGRGAVLYGYRIEQILFVGMKAVIMDEASIGESVIMTPSENVLPSNCQDISRNSLGFGSTDGKPSSWIKK